MSLKKAFMHANGCCRQYKLLIRMQILLDLGVKTSGGKKHNPWTILCSVNRVDYNRPFSTFVPNLLRIGHCVAEIRLLLYTGAGKLTSPKRQFLCVQYA